MPAAPATAASVTWLPICAPVWTALYFMMALAAWVAFAAVLNAALWRLN